MAAAGLLSPPTKQGLQVLLSPSKQVLCSPTRQPLSTCTMNICRQPLSPLVKRSLSALHAFSSATHSIANSSSSSATQEHVAVCGTAAGLSPLAGATHSSTAATVPQLDPLLLQALSGGSTGQGLLQQHQSQTSSAAVSRSRPASISLSAMPCTAPSSHRSVVHQKVTIDTVAPAAAALLLPKSDVFEFPPELEAADDAPDDHDGVPTSHEHDSSNVPGEQPHRRPVMSGRRLTRRFDVPLGLDWLANAPDQPVAGLGAGQLELIMGPMFAGKTTKLLQRVQEVSSGGQIAVAVKSSKDERYGCHWVVTHDGRCMRCYTADSLQQFKQIMGPHYQKLQVLAIDEAQFFPDLLDFCRTAVDLDGKHVIVAGLSGDFKRQRFGQLLELMPLADNITQLRSKCAFCDQDGLFSLRIIKSGPQALVGGDDKYKATCRRCYLTHTLERQ